MSETGESPSPKADDPVPCLPIDYSPPPPRQLSTRFGFTVFCLALFSLAFMGTSLLMYFHFFAFHQRQIQIMIARASIALGGISAVLSPIALFFRRGIYEICAVIGAFVYWLIFILLLHA